MSETRRLTDAPWFWAYVFASAALAAILLAGPKYVLRQSQLERQYRARFEAQQVTEVPGVREATDQAAHPYITLWPLATLLGAVTLGCGAYLALRKRRSHGQSAGR